MAIANEVCQRLETSGFACWIAPRDVMPGADWSEAIVQAIADTQILLLIFSSASNASEPVKNEVVTAADLRKQIVPFRIEDTAPAAALKFHLASRHWLDGFEPPLEPHLARLVSSLGAILNVQRHEAPLTSRLDQGIPEPEEKLSPRETALFPLPTCPRKSALFHSVSYLRSLPNVRRLILPFEGSSHSKKLKRIRYCRNPVVLWNILKSAIKNDVSPGGISPLSCFKRWTADESILFRVLEEVNVADSPRKGPRIRTSGFKGFYSIFPLTELAHESLESGALHYDLIDSSHTGPERNQDILGENTAASSKWLFILDFEIVMPSVAAPYLVFDLIEHLRQWLDYDTRVKGVSTLAATPKGEEFARTFGFRRFSIYLNASGHGWKIFFLDRNEIQHIISKITPQFMATLTSTVKQDYTLDPAVENSISRIILQLRRITAPTQSHTSR